MIPVNASKFNKFEYYKGNLWDIRSYIAAEWSRNHETKADEVPVVPLEGILVHKNDHVIECKVVGSPLQGLWKAGGVYDYHRAAIYLKPTACRCILHCLTTGPV